MINRAGVLSAALALAACHKASPAGPQIAEDAAASTAPTASSAQPSTTAAPRCKATDVGFALDDGRSLDDLEIGDALSTPAGVVVNLVHRTVAGRVAAVAQLSPDAASVKVRDLGPILGDAPPPRVAARGGDLIAATYVLGKKPDSRQIDLAILSASGEVRPAGSITEQRDDSLAFDVASGLVVWDEAAPPSHRGVIRGAELTPDGRVGASRDVSPPDSDAEAPRVVATGGGYLVFWIARKAEAPLQGDATVAQEITGEAPANSWLEVIALDQHAQAAGPARRLTPLSGHVSGFDITSLSPATPGARPLVLAVARDDGEAVDGSGGSILRIRVHDDGQDPPVAFATDGLGRGAPELVEASPPWLAWVALREEARILPLDAAGAPAGLPSGESLLDDGRPLAALGAGNGADGASAPGVRRLLVAMPSDPVAQLRIMACAAE